MPWQASGKSRRAVEVIPIRGIQSPTEVNFEVVTVKSEDPVAEEEKVDVVMQLWWFEA